MLTYAMDERGKKTKLDFLYLKIKDDILALRLKANEKLPSKRALSEHLGVSVTTVENAYMLLVAEGYLYTKPKSGFFVSSIAEEMGKATPKYFEKPRSSKKTEEVSIEFSQETQDTLFQFSALSKIMRRVITQYDRKLLAKPPHFGLDELRKAIADHLYKYRGMDVSFENIVIGSGAEYLYSLLAQFFPRGSIFGVEDPSYDKIRLVYLANNVKIEMLKMGKDGITSEELEKTKAAVLHITPFNSYPTGVSASPEKRMEYIAWAHETGGYIIEDDFDSEFTTGKKPIETLYSMDKSSSVIYMNTFSKSLSPSMRIGYMVLSEKIIEHYKKKLGFYSCTVPLFDQYVLAKYISEGYFEKHLNRVRRSLKQNKDGVS